MAWWDYVQTVSGRATNAAIAELIGVTPPSVGRWKGGRPDPARAAAFARAYGRPVLEAFIKAGFLTADEAGQVPAAQPDITQLSDDELLAEVERRIKKGGHDGWQPEAEKIRRGPITGHGA